MSEKEYIVVLKKGVDFTRFHEQMLELQGRDGIPNRQVEVANERPASARLTHYYLTDAEASELQSNENVIAVEIPYWNNPHIEIGHDGQGSDPERPYRKYGRIDEFSDGEGYPWQFPQFGGITNRVEPWGGTDDGVWDSTYTGTYVYGADGEGVDIVIQDTGVDAEHYEFQDANGVSRVNKIDWAAVTGIGLSPSNLNDYYRDWVGHGTHVASTAAGKSMGYARGAQIYAQKLSFGAMGVGYGGLTEYTDYADAFDQIKIFHRNKPVDSNGNKRPTIVNMSWGWTVQYRSDYISSINYRGNTYSSDADLRPNNDSIEDHKYRNLHYGAGWLYYGGNNSYYGGTDYPYTTTKIAFYQATLVAEIEELIDEGVHVVTSAGNSNEYIAEPSHVDWNNTITLAPPSPAPTTPWPGLTSGTYYLHRGGVHHPDSFVVGNLNIGYRRTFQLGDTGRPTGPYKIEISGSSGRGPGVALWHPGTSILGASSGSGPFVPTDPSRSTFNTPNKYVFQGATEIRHPLDSTEGLLKLSGTSMAAPGVTGILSCILEKNPGLTPAQLKAFVADSSNNATIQNAIQEGYPDDPAYIDGISALGTETGWRSHLSGAGGALMGGPNRIAYQQYNTLAPTYSVTAPTTIEENSTDTINVSTNNVTDGTTLYWTVTPAADFSISYGSFNINNNTGSFTLSPLDDSVTEGDETATIEIRTGSTSGTVVATTTFTITEPVQLLPPTYFIDVPSTITVGTSTTVTVITQNVSNGTVLYWEATPTSSFQVTSVSSGQFTINSNRGSFTLIALSSTATQGTLTIRTGSPTGTSVATSTFTIAPAPTAPVTSGGGTFTTYVGRPHTTRRSSIIEALVREFKKINANGDFLTDVFNNVHPRLKFWDEIEEFPAIHINAGSETREYQGAGYRDRYLNVTIRCYVQEEDAVIALDKLLEDVETVLDENGALSYTDKQGLPQKTHDIKIVSIETDEGVLEPYGVGEILAQVHY